ncbi:hypothetical protein [Halogeometricum borinquense]|uniref:hypothetical protein n=1 Tax=Halogeometricum borinquense TaxID=60847 RepID=UPI0034359A31
MTDESTPDREAFGELYPISHDRFGLVNGGALGGGFGWLHDHVKEEEWGRGFFGQADREFLLETPPTDLTTASARSTRQRIRNRILSTFFDARLLRYIDQRDREIIFQNARDAGYGLHFREGFKEFVRFTYLGLLELETDIDTTEILEAAIREAEQEHALERGENVSVQVDIDVTVADEDSVEDLERRYHKHDRLSRHELAVLVNSQHENDDDVEAAADIDLADALYYDARQPVSDPHGYSWEDPDREEAEEIVEWLRSVFEEYDIETHDDLQVAIDRLRVVEEDLGAELNEKLNRLTRAAPNFPSQLAADANLPASDMALLHEILWNPDNIDVETALEEEVRPRTAGDDWSPAEDENLQKFIARVQVAREMNDGFTSGGEEGRERWRKLLELAEFDEEEWGDYIHERRVEAAKDVIRKVFEEHDESFDPNQTPTEPPSDEKIEELAESPSVARSEEELREVFTSDPVTDPPGRDDLDDVRTADEFREKFGETHNTTEVGFLEVEVGEDVLAEAFEELSEEWQEAER